MTTNIKTVRTDHDVMLDIVIKPVENRPHVWHVHIKETNKKEEKEKDCIIPHDVFGYMIEEFASILNFVRAIHHATYEIRKIMKQQAKRPKRKNEEPIKQKPVTKHSANAEIKLLEGRRRNLESLVGMTERMKNNLKTEDMLHQTALALALAEFSYDEIKKIIKKNREFKQTLAITDYPNLQAMQQTQSSSMFESLSGFLNFGSSIMSFIPH